MPCSTRLTAVRIYQFHHRGKLFKLEPPSGIEPPYLAFAGRAPNEPSAEVKRLVSLGRYRILTI